jgi:hypothetical protein
MNGQFSSKWQNFALCVPSECLHETASHHRKEEAAAAAAAEESEKAKAAGIPLDDEEAGQIVKVGQQTCMTATGGRKTALHVTICSMGAKFHQLTHNASMLACHV